MRRCIVDNLTPLPRLYGSDSLRDGVIVPILQALATGILSGLALAGVLWLAGVEIAWRWSLALIPVVWLVMWLASLSHWRASLERLLNRDLNNDGVIGEQQPPVIISEPAREVRVTLERDEGRHVDIIDLPAQPEQLRQLADGLLSGRQFALSAWSGAGAPFSRSEFERLRDELIKRGLARWRNANAQAQGAELTLPGRAVLRRFASDASSLSPTLRTR